MHGLCAFPTRRSSDLHEQVGNALWVDVADLHAAPVHGDVCQGGVTDAVEKAIHDCISHAALTDITVDWSRSEEHTSELQSHSELVCRLLLEENKQPPR